MFEALRQSDATWKVIVNEVPIAQLFVDPYDRWEGYAAERKEILDFIRTSGMRNVVFITGDLHGNIITDVRRDTFTDATPIAKEFIAGPIAQVTFADQLAASPDSERTANGLPTPLGPLVLPDCANLSTFAYGLVEVDSATKRLTVTLKNDAGQAFCSATLLPSGLRPRQD
ncbi:MAG: alkaline phosphatase D family protein [Candidatus Tectomicrobia bacterium]|uniref:Alkaline phosphatase D family protein n=1 Tax=Tectimicrobiota bacterium TaxID=2528274 RepID=A0A932CQB5_UNCTE|nr:alkaline phosphatase D family protein [Candidatus Tectomicrobia bacterium]